MIPNLSTRRLIATAPCLLLLGSTGCATVFHGTSQDIQIVAAAPASVAIDGVTVGTTPMIASVTRRRAHVVTLTRDSAPPVEVELRRSLSALIWGNALIDYIPVVVDLWDGAAFKFEREFISASFPGRETSAAMIRAHLAVGQRIRFSTDADDGLMNAGLDSCTADTLYLRTGHSASAREFIFPGRVAVRDVRRLDVGVIGDRWTPYEAHRAGSPLLVDDRVRINFAGRDSSIDGRLVTMDTLRLQVATPTATLRLDRSLITSMQRQHGHDYAEGAARALMIGALVGAVAGARIHGDVFNPDGVSIMRGGAIGAVVGLSFTGMLAPGKWVSVRNW